jgi:hypothetical protein
MLKTVSSITNAIGALNYKGTWNASTNTPTLASGVGTKGDYYVVSVAGSTTLDGISNWGIGDLATFNGSVWQRVEGGADGNFVNLSVSSTSTLSGLTASTALALDASKNIVSVTNTGTGSNVLATSPSLVTPALGAATATSLASSGQISTNVDAAVTSFSAVCSAGDQTATSLKLVSGRTDTFYHIQAFNGTTTECFRVEANGNTKNTNNSYGSLSDIKIKENVVDATPKLDDLMKVRIRNYNIIGETTKQIGVVAQELEEIFPGMVDETQDRDVGGEFLGTTTKGVKYSVFVPILVKAIQELKAEFDAYKASHP